MVYYGTISKWELTPNWKEQRDKVRRGEIQCQKESGTTWWSNGNKHGLHEDGLSCLIIKLTEANINTRELLRERNIIRDDDIQDYLRELCDMGIIKKWVNVSSS